MARMTSREREQRTQRARQQALQRESRQRSEPRQEKKRRGQKAAPAQARRGQASPIERARKRAARRRFRRRLQTLLLFALCVALGGLCYFLSHNILITGLEVEGTSIYTEEQIYQAAGLAVGQEFLLVKTKQAQQIGLSNLPYLESVSITRHLPATLRVEVVAAEPLCRALAGEQVVVVSTTGRVLGEASQHPLADSLPLLTAKLELPATPGQPLPFLSKNDSAICVDIFAALQDNDILSSVTSVDMENTVELSLVLEERITVKLGDSIDLKEKLQLVAESVRRLGGQSGTMDASSVGMAKFKPGRATVQIAQSQPAQESVEEREPVEEPAEEQEQ